MNFVLILICLLVAIHSSCGIPTGNKDESMILRQRRDSDVFGNTRQIIGELAKNLQDSAQRVIRAVDNFSTGIQEEIVLYTDKLNTDIQKFKTKISDAVNVVNDSVNEVAEGLAGCIESRRQQTDILISQTYNRSITCADNRIKELNEMIDNLNADAQNALGYTRNVIERMKNCSIQDNGYILNVGLCLGSIVLQAQNKGMIFFANSGILIARINLAIGTLPAAFEICASSNIIEASVATAKIIMEIGSCSLISILS